MPSAFRATYCKAKAPPGFALMLYRICRRPGSGVPVEPVAVKGTHAEDVTAMSPCAIVFATKSPNNPAI